MTLKTLNKYNSKWREGTKFFSQIYCSQSVLELYLVKAYYFIKGCLGLLILRASLCPTSSLFMLRRRKGKEEPS
jgi:hypothetical protein